MATRRDLDPLVVQVEELDLHNYRGGQSWLGGLWLCLQSDGEWKTLHC